MILIVLRIPYFGKFQVQSQREPPAEFFIVEYPECLEDVPDLVRYVLFFQQIPNLSASRTAP